MYKSLYMSLDLQGGHLNMAVLFWYLVKSYLSATTARVKSSVHWTSLSLQGTRKAQPSLSGRVVPDMEWRGSKMTGSTVRRTQLII